jgi:hypothetical protein
MAGFNDGNWLVGNSPFYYENASGYSGNTALDDMNGNYSCIFMRKVFTISNPDTVGTLTINLRTDDGAIVWINGTRVTLLGMPDREPVFNDVSTDDDGEPKEQIFIITDTSLLVRGDNLIAVQAFNSSLADSSDFLVALSLTYDIDDVPPALLTIDPPVGSLVQSLTFVTIIFAENVEGMNPTDLLINDSPATSMTAVSGREYQFNFDQPSNGTVEVKFAIDHGIQDPIGNAFIAQAWTYDLNPNAFGAVVLLNEFMADNDHGIHDDFNNQEDWIEILNLGPVQVDLGGWFLTDNPAKLTKWRFPQQRCGRLFGLVR